MSDQFVEISHVLRLAGYSRSSMYRAMNAGRFPRPVNVGPRSARWSLREVEDWMEDLLRRRDELDAN